MRLIAIGDKKQKPKLVTNWIRKLKNNKDFNAIKGKNQDFFKKNLVAFRLFVKVTQLCTKLSYIMYTMCTSCDCVIVGLQKKKNTVCFLKG